MTRTEWIVAERCYFCGEGEQGEYIAYAVDGIVRAVCEGCVEDTESIADMDYSPYADDWESHRDCRN